jgi:hypothetical protein
MLDLRQAEHWKGFVFGRYPQKLVILTVQDPVWQALRASLLNTTLEEKFTALVRYVGDPTVANFEQRCVQVTNYVHALKRGGLIK